MTKILFPAVTLWGKTDKTRGIGINGDMIYFVNCVGAKEDESVTLNVKDVSFVKHLAKYKLFVLEGAAVNDPRNLIIIADKDEKNLAQINVFRFKKLTLIAFLKKLRELNPEINFDQTVNEIIDHTSFKRVNWSFFLAILRGIRIYFFILVIYLAVSFVRNIKLISVFTFAVILTVVIFRFLIP